MVNPTDAKKRVYLFREGNKGMKDLLGGKVRGRPAAHAPRPRRLAPRTARRACACAAQTG